MNPFILIGSVNNKERPNAEIYYSNEDLEEVEKIKDLILKYKEKDENEEYLEAEAILKELNKEYVCLFTEEEKSQGCKPEIDILGIFGTKRED